MDNQKNIENQDNASAEQQSQENEVIIDPYQVVNPTNKEIDYSKIIEQFGCKPIDIALIQRIENITGMPAHPFLKRGIFFSHRDLEKILDDYEKGKIFYLYTGRGPSSEAMHLGHMLPFYFTKYLQDAFDVPVVIQITDDEKFYHKGSSKEDINDYTKYGIENIKDILCVGFDINKTFIFLDSEYIQYLYRPTARVLKHLTFNQLKGIFGLTQSDNCGKCVYPAIQAAPCFSECFPHIFDPKIFKKGVNCLIPQGIDQDPYFRMTRDIIERLKYPKPACIHSNVKGFHTKMSASDKDTSIFMTDSPNEIKRKINKHAFSGGQPTAELQKEKGANLEVDIPYHFLKFFMEDDEEFYRIGQEYQAGRMLTGEIKKITIDLLTKIIRDHQEKRKNIDDTYIRQFMEIRKINPFPSKDRITIKKKQ